MRLMSGFDPNFPQNGLSGKSISRMLKVGATICWRSLLIAITLFVKGVS